MIPELWQTKFFIMNPLMDYSDQMENISPTWNCSEIRGPNYLTIHHLLGFLVVFPTIYPPGDPWTFPVGGWTTNPWMKTMANVKLGTHLFPKHRGKTLNNIWVATNLLFKPHLTCIYSLKVGPLLSGYNSTNQGAQTNPVITPTLLLANHGIRSRLPRFSTTTVR